MANKYETIIGLEIHLQLKVKTKMFSPAANEESAQPNTLINPIDLGHPGTLPLINRQAVELAVKLGLALNMEIQIRSEFDRKHYFYPDLPKGYQITQFAWPICLNGSLSLLLLADGEFQTKTFRFERLHLEEDSAKSFHFESGSEGVAGSTAVDYNRAGCALVEIVTKPDFRHPSEAKAFLEELKRYCRYVGASDAEMEKGHLRVDANISLRPAGENKLYPKTEIKNLNSFRSVERALSYQIQEQTALWEAGNPPTITRTVGWRDTEGLTVIQRIKEEATDYRYFPEPDVNPIILTAEQIQTWQAELPELPGQKRQRFIQEYDLKPQAVNHLIDDQNLANYFEQTVSELADNLSEIEVNSEQKRGMAKLAYGWITSELVKLLNQDKKSIEQSTLEPGRLADLLALIYRRQINSTNAQKVLAELYHTSATLDTVLSQENYLLGGDDIDINEIADQIILANPKQVTEYQAGKLPLIQYLIGQGMKISQGRIDADELKTVLIRKLTKGN